MRSIFGDLVKQHLSWHWAFRPVLSSAARSKSSTRSSSPNYRATTILNNEAKNRRKKRLERYLRVTSELDPSVEILAKGFQQKSACSCHVTFSHLLTVPLEISDHDPRECFPVLGSAQETRATNSRGQNLTCSASIYYSALICKELCCEDLPLPLAHVGDKKVKRFHFSEITGRLPYVRATVTEISSTTLCLLRYFLRTATVMGRKQTGDELNARAKANGYKRGGTPGRRQSSRLQ